MKKQDRNNKPTVNELKVRFLEYYSKLPNKSLAAGYIGRNQDTILRWEDADVDFAEAVQKARSNFAINKIARVRDEKWILAHTLKDEFADRTEITGADGDSIKIEVLNGKNYSIPKSGQTGTTSKVDTT